MSEMMEACMYRKLMKSLRSMIACSLYVLVPNMCVNGKGNSSCEIFNFLTECLSPWMCVFLQLMLPWKIWWQENICICFACFLYGWNFELRLRKNDLYLYCMLLVLMKPWFVIMNPWWIHARNKKETCIDVLCHYSLVVDSFVALERSLHVLFYKGRIPLLGGKEEVV